MSLYFLELRGFKEDENKFSYRSLIQQAGVGVRLAKTKTLESADEDKMLSVSERIGNVSEEIKTKGHQFFDLELTDDQAHFFGWV